ncbi:MAG: TlpA family protein disulfide reductase [Deltaproteobacteria bacterium]|nr:TlpA family protein disulfide reductase [Deltaproteobacteria bacterium]
MLRKVALFSCFILLAPILVAGVQAADVKVGAPMPEFSLKGEDGKVYNLESIKGKKTVFTFMQAACSACRGEVVLLNDLAKVAKDVLFLPISVDMGGAKALERYKADYAITLTFLLDPEFQFPPKFGFTYTPATALIGADGKVAALLSGFDDDTAKKIKEFVKK